MKTTQEYAAQIAAKWNLTLTSEYAGAHNPVEFLCQQGHPNKATATNLLQRGYKCKQCVTGRPVESKISWTDSQILKVQELFDQGKTTQEIAEFFHTTKTAIDNVVAKYEIVRSKSVNTTKALQEILALQKRELVSTNEVCSAHDYVQLRCSKHHVVTQLVSNVLYKGTDCPTCATQQPSREQQALVQFIKAHYSGWVIEGDRTILEGQELDVVLPDIGLAIEYNGTYWHSSLKVPPDYHLTKTLQAEQEGFQLIHVNSYDWNTRGHVVKAKLQHLLQPQPRIGARHTKVQSIDWKTTSEFLERTHIQGAGAPTRHNYGLYYDNKLVAVATFQQPRFDHQWDMELVRYSTSQPVQGGAGKLLKHAQRQLKFTSLVTYALRDWSQGKLYQALGFVHHGDTPPGYAYYKHNQKLSRYQCQKHKLKTLLAHYDPQLSEAENMKQHGWYQVYDTGSQRWVKCY